MFMLGNMLLALAARSLVGMESVFGNRSREGRITCIRSACVDFRKRAALKKETQNYELQAKFDVMLSFG